MNRYTREYMARHIWRDSNWAGNTLRKRAWFFYFKQGKDSDRELSAYCLNDARREREKANKYPGFRGLYYDNVRQEIKWARDSRMRFAPLP